jgi:hypothetical protein
MRARISMTPFLLPPAINRVWRWGFAILFLAGLALAAKVLLQTIHRIQSGEAIFGHLLISIFLVAYLLYLLIKLVLLPSVEK